MFYSNAFKSTMKLFEKRYNWNGHASAKSFREQNVISVLPLKFPINTNEFYVIFGMGKEGRCIKSD